MKRKPYFFVKRVLDILLSLLALIVLSPIFAILIIVIKIDSNGPVFFKQTRLGKHGKNFNIIKFRTMIVNAEHKGDGIFVKSGEDNRITPVGNILRKTSLDELPQLWNVVKGDMSLVGPRPPLEFHPYKYENYSKNQKLRFEMRPGITGLAQVKVRNSLPWDDRIIYDVQYIKESNLIVDIKILLMTVKKIFISENIYTK